MKERNIVNNREEKKKEADIATTIKALHSRIMIFPRFVEYIH